MQRLAEVFALLNVSLACERLHIRTFDDIEVLAARRIIRDWMKMGAAKNFERMLSPQALFMVLEKMTFVAFSQFGQLCFNRYL